MKIDISPLTRANYFHLKVDYCLADFLHVKDNSTLQNVYETWCYYKANTIHKMIGNLFPNSIFLVTIHDQAYGLLQQVTLHTEHHNFFLELCNYCTLVSDLTS